jgi:hypothetical protein
VVLRLQLRRVFVAFGVGKIISLNRGSEPASVTACGSPATSQKAFVVVIGVMSS